MAPRIVAWPGASTFIRPALRGDLDGVRVGVAIENQFSDQADPATRPAFDAAVAVLAAQGADVREVRLPYWSEMATANMVTMESEALAYHRADLRARWGTTSR